MALEFKKAGYEYKGWKLGQSVEYKGKRYKIIAFDIEQEEDHNICINRLSSTYDTLYEIGDYIDTKILKGVDVSNSYKWVDSNKISPVPDTIYLDKLKGKEKEMNGIVLESDTIYGIENYNIILWDKQTTEYICSMPIFIDNLNVWEHQQKLLKSFGFDVELVTLTPLANAKVELTSNTKVEPKKKVEETKLVLPSKFYIKAKSKKRWIQIMEVLEKLGYEWIKGEKPTEFENWDSYSVIYVEDRKIQFGDGGDVDEWVRVKFRSLRSLLS